ncbi:MAG: radical SAM family heme chaperone HemW [Clostridia bacterium]|nr:radical SAM family heme chaperone HemW [Clostridia bacterium]
MNKLSLYLHFPFCKKKCNYCDFYSLPNLSLITPYEKVLCKSFSAFSDKARGYEVETIYFGGGTPSLFTTNGIGEVFSSLRNAFSISPDAEITVEMNPESASEELLRAFVEEGANRISMGVQSTLEEELSLLGRIHRFSHVKEAVQRAKNFGIDNINLDLMYGLPNQTLLTFKKSLEEVLLLSPKHISFYLLTLSPDVPLYQRKAELPEDEAVEEMYFFASEFLKQNGFEHYEISNAALPGYRSRHNQVYWNGGEYLGFGPGAHSYFGSERFFVKDGVEEFIFASDGTERISSPEKITPKDKRDEYLMLSLRLKDGICLEKLAKIASQEFCENLIQKMTLWSKHGLCEKTSRGFALTTKGFFVSNEIISELM